MLLCTTFCKIEPAIMIQILIMTDFLPNIAKIFVCFDEKICCISSVFDSIPHVYDRKKYIFPCGSKNLY